MNLTDLPMQLQCEYLLVKRQSPGLSIDQALHQAAFHIDQRLRRKDVWQVHHADPNRRWEGEPVTIAEKLDADPRIQRLLRARRRRTR